MFLPLSLLIYKQLWSEVVLVIQIYDQNKITLNWEKKIPLLQSFITSDKYSPDHNYVFLFFYAVSGFKFFLISAF